MPKTETQEVAYSFRKAWGLMPFVYRKKAKEELMRLLNLTSESTFYARLNGQIEPKVSEAKGIESIFRRYGVAKENVWGGSEL